MTLTDNIYERIADKIRDSIEFDHFAVDGEIDIDKTSFVVYEFEGEGRMVDYYAADYLTPSQWDVEADVTGAAFYVTKDGEEPVEISELKKYLNTNIQITS